MGQIMCIDTNKLNNWFNRISIKLNVFDEIYLQIVSECSRMLHYSMFYNFPECTLPNLSRVHKPWLTIVCIAILFGKTYW